MEYVVFSMSAQDILARRAVWFEGAPLGADGHGQHAGRSVAVARGPGLHNVTPAPVEVPESMTKSTPLAGFGPRLTALRQSQGLTQTELGKAAGISQRMVAYYELESAQPSGALLVDFARALQVSADELLGLAPTAPRVSPRTARLLKRLQRIEELPPADQRAGTCQGV